MSDLIEQKGFSAFLTDFKLLPRVLEARDSLRVFTFLTNGTVKEGYSDLVMFENIPVFVAAI